MEETMQAAQNQASSDSRTPPNMPPTKHNSPATFFVAGGIFAVFLFICMFGILYGLSKKQSSPTIVSSSPMQTSPTQEATAAASIPLVNFKKRQYDPNKLFFSNKNYPGSLTNVPDNQLIGLSCSLYYQSDYHGGYLATDTPTLLRLTDTKLLNFFTTASASAKTPIAAGRYCLTADNRTILEYEIWRGNDMVNNTVYLGMVNTDGSITQEAVIPNDGSSYFDCNSILQVTNQNVAYVGCSGGNTSGAEAYIYTINLQTHQIVQMQKCTSGLDQTECSNTE